MTDNNRTGIILAAGLGTRLCSFDSEIQYKPLAHIDNMTLLLRTINNHEVAGCKRVIIVLGWQAENIKSSIMAEYSGSVHLHFVVNDNYRLKNGISVLCAKPFVGEEFILTMADHILDDGIMLLTRGNHPPSDGATLCVDYKINSIFDIDDATKVYSENDFIKSIGKNIKNFNCIDTGVFIGTRGLMDAIENVYKKKGDAALSEGVQFLCDQGLMKSLDIKNCFWQDVDTPEMLAHAAKILKLNKI